MKLFAFALLICVSACGASSPVKIRTPSGLRGVNVECLRTREQCLADAGWECGVEGFHIVSESSHSGGVWWDWFPGFITWHEMQVECGNPHHEIQGIVKGIAPDGSRVIMPTTPHEVLQNPYDIRK